MFVQKVIEPQCCVPVLGRGNPCSLFAHACVGVVDAAQGFNKLYGKKVMQQSLKSVNPEHFPKFWTRKRHPPLLKSLIDGLRKSLEHWSSTSA